MRVAAKLALAVILVMVSVFSLRAYEAAGRQKQAADAYIREVQFIIGRALRPSIREVWHSDSKERALSLVKVANDRISRARRVEIHWVSFRPALSEPHRSRLSDQEVSHLAADDDLTLVKTVEEKLFTYVPVTINGRIEGALEISQTLDDYNAQLRAELSALLWRSAVGATVSIVAVSLLGFVVVGRPMRLLADKARRIGRGDLEGPLTIRQRDEIGLLADEVNDMCSRLKAAQQRIQEETSARIKALEQLRHADRLTTVGTLASGIAHELGTPLNVVSGRARMIATGEATGPEALASAQIIAEQVDRITRIIRQLLDFARRRTPERGLTSLRGLVDQTLTLLAPIAQKKGVTLAQSAEKNGEATALVDGAQIQQALTNLVVNGVQAMPGGGRVEVSLRRTEMPAMAELGHPAGMYWAIAVRDHGTGISADELPRVFEPFFTTKDVGEGTGLGLSVAHGIARDHGGWIDVQSELGKGSVFTLYVPAGKEKS